MANASKLPTSSELYLGQWSNPDAPAPVLDAPLDADDTIIKVSAPLKNSASVIVTGGFPMGIKKANGWVENVWVPAGAVSADGLTIGSVSIPVVRGIKPNGYDYTVGSTDFADSHEADEPVFCNIPAYVPELIRSVLQGLIATGGSDFIIGIDAAGTVTVKRSSGTGASLGFLRWYTTSTKVEFSNDGSTWTAISDATGSVIFKVSSADTTAGYAQDKIQAGNNITITKVNTGANEYLSIATSLPTQITSPGTYTPAYLTGDNSAESNYLLWLGTSDGSFAITVNGTLRNVTGIDFTSGVTSMANVATKIQTALRALTGSTETVVWSTDHFIISSVLTTSSSAITVTSATGGGTDISGAGAFGGLGCDTGHGVVTNKVLDQTQDVGKVALLDSTGKFNSQLVPIPSVVTADAAELNKLDGASANVTAANLNTLTGGGNANALHTHSGSFGYSGSADFSSGVPSNTVIAHGLGIAPGTVRVSANVLSVSSQCISHSDGGYTGSGNKCTYWFNKAGATCAVNNAAYGIYVVYQDTTNYFGYGTISVDATNITFAWGRDAANFVGVIYYSLQAS